MPGLPPSPSFLPYLRPVVAVAVLGVLAHAGGGAILAHLAAIDDAPSAPVLAAFALFALCSFASFYATQGTPIPSFVVAIVLGMAGRPLFLPIVSNPIALSSVVTAGAAVILFGGGLEMSGRVFLRLAVKVLLLAVPGLILTGIAFSATLQGLAGLGGGAIGIAVAIMLGAILAPTDPAAIIPALHGVRFKRRTARDIVVAESAINDVAGTLLTSALLKLPLAGLSIGAAYAALATGATAASLARQATVGALAGLAGFAILWLLSQIKLRRAARYGADQILFVATPLMAFAAAAAFGGSGFLAAFVAGLLFNSGDHMAEIERFFYQVIDGIAKPAIFLLVGAMVDPHALVAYAPLGIAAALLFMFVLRPAMVFLLLGPYVFLRGSPRGLSVNELLFVSFVRETGAIPAVLLVTAVARMTGPADGLVEIGMWVILLTLVIAPPLTPYIARRLGVAE